MVIKRIDEMNCTIEEFSIICDISSREISNIKNRTAKDIKFNTFVKLCENAGISYIDIFGYNDRELVDREIQKFILTDGEQKYSICRK